MMIVPLLAIIVILVVNIPARLIRVLNCSIPIENYDVDNMLDFFEHDFIIAIIPQ